MKAYTITIRHLEPNHCSLGGMSLETNITQDEFDTPLNEKSAALLVAEQSHRYANTLMKTAAMFGVHVLNKADAVSQRDTLIQKLSDELFEVTGKIVRLNTFLDSEAYESLDGKHKVLLVVQRRHMMDYMKAIRDRIDLLKEQGDE
jgi:hypothetical protein